MSNVTFHTALNIFADDTHDLRFESFCLDIISAAEGGRLVLPTSQSWDLSRDGRGGPGNADLFVCATQRDDLDKKAIDDVNGLMKHIKIKPRVYYCSTQKMSEHRLQSIEHTLEDETDDNITCSAYGSIQLAKLASTYPEIFNRHYASEVREHFRALAADIDPESEELGLRLALMSCGQSESALIRSELYSVILLEALSTERGQTLQTCGKEAGRVLRLSTNVSSEAIQPHLALLNESGFASYEDGIYSITDLGKARLLEQKTAGNEQLLEGRLSIREAIEESVGAPLADDHFERIWKLLQKRLTQHFYSKGMSMVEEITDLLDTPSDDSSNAQRAPSSSIGFLDDLAKEVAATSRNQQQQKELQQAVVDIFRDRAGPAAEWLVALAASFISACSLGLEVGSADAIERLLAQITLVLDSDVLLSLIGEGEPEHAGVLAIVGSWPKLGGRVLVAESVLEEVAYHASIGEKDFEAVHSWLPGTREDRLRLIENVFVRSFAESMARKAARLSDWPRYIKGYKGDSSRDWRTLYEVIAGDFNIRKLPPRSTEEAQLEGAVKAFLIAGIPSTFSGTGRRNAEDKARRDAELYAAMVHFIRISSSASSHSQCVLISSAHRLYMVEQQFAELSETHFVLPISVILQLLSLVPGVSLGINALQAFLFEERRGAFSSDFERNVVRLVKNSREYTLPWAKRGQLTRVLREKLLTEAGKSLDQVDERPSTMVERHAFDESHRARTIELIAKSLDELAVDTKSEEQARLARSQLADANAEIEHLRKQLREAARRKK